MSGKPEEFEELARDIRNLIRDNKRFLDRVMEEDFEPEADEIEAEDSVEDFEEL